MDKNFVSLLEATADRYPEKPALLCHDVTLTYRELHARAANFAYSLADKGVRNGDRVVLLLPNHWSFVVAVLGVWKLGATAVPLSSLLKGHEEEMIVADVEPVRVIKSIGTNSGDWQLCCPTKNSL